MQLSMKGLNEEQAEAKRTECIVRLKIRENDIKSQMWKLMTDNSLESVVAAEGETSKIFEDLGNMIVDLFDILQGRRTRKPEDEGPTLVGGKPADASSDDEDLSEGN